MARRRKGEDAAEWVPPAFDEVEFMKQEISAGKASVFAVLYAILVALVSYGITLARLPIVAFFAGLGMIFLLRYLLPYVKPFTGIDSSRFKRRDWIGHGSVVFFSWLAFWILLLNTPFGDFTRPDITAVSVAGAASTTDLQLSCKDLVPGDNGALDLAANETMLYVAFRVTDNVAVSSMAAALNSQNLSLSPADTNRCRGGSYPGGTVETFFTPATAGVVYTLKLTAVDTSGNAWSLTYRFPTI